MATDTKQVNWLYEGRDHRGQRMRGRLMASTLTLARAELRRRGIAPTKVHREKQKTGKRIKPADIAYMSRQLATMLAAGVPMVQTFTVLGQGSDNPKMRSLMLAIATDIESGTSLSEALAKYPKYFDELYTSLVSTGEQSGKLEELLGRIATYKEKTEELKRKIKKALMYPTAVVVAAVLVTTILMVFVIPKFKGFYADFGAKLPAFTNWVIGISNSMTQIGWLYLLILIAVIVGIVSGRRRSPKFHRFQDRLLLKIPVIGMIMKKSAVARFARTLSIVQAAGVPMVEGLETVANATGNMIYQEAVMQISKQVATGQRIARAMDETNVFPGVVTQMIGIGEESGEIDAMAAKVAEFYELEVDTLVDGLSQLLEPMIMVVLGVVVGALVIAMYLPIFNLGNVV
ncbi:MAG: type II secretion system F family protein [Gammaproteobacteria bacterium]